MKEILRQTVLHNYGFWVLAGFSMLLFLIGIITPPPGIIDSSVLYAGGEILGFAALYTVLHSIDKGLDAKFQHKDTSLTIGDLNKHNEDKDEL